MASVSESCRLYSSRAGRSSMERTRRWSLQIRTFGSFSLEDEGGALNAPVGIVSISRVIISSVFFFFQAEDGIRDVAVTGVQTCALPISLCDSSSVFKRSQSAVK